MKYVRFLSQILFKSKQIYMKYTTSVPNSFRSILFVSWFLQTVFSKECYQFDFLNYYKNNSSVGDYS